jgi:multiple sugar transport system substrate-binding protein
VDTKTSKVIDKVGALMLPDRAGCSTAPPASWWIATRNAARMRSTASIRAPFAAFGGWSGGINAKAKPQVKDAAYALISYMSQPEQSNVDVTIGATGFNPYRISQFKDLAQWKKAACRRRRPRTTWRDPGIARTRRTWCWTCASRSTSATSRSRSTPAIARYLAGEIDTKATMKTIEDAWNEITDESRARPSSRRIPEHRWRIEPPRCRPPLQSRRRSRRARVLDLSARLSALLSVSRFSLQAGGSTCNSSGR